jgi:hypothetical protein
MSNLTNDNLHLFTELEELDVSLRVGLSASSVVGLINVLVQVLNTHGNLWIMDKEGNSVDGIRIHTVQTSGPRFGPTGKKHGLDDAHQLALIFDEDLDPETTDYWGN